MAHILIADDNPTIAGLLGRMLARLGHTSQAAGDGLAALGCREQRPFDMLITDLDMPRLSGAALMRVLAREGKYREPDILLVRDARDPRRQNRFWLGADLVAEIVSEDDPERDTKVKRADYAYAGIP